jgi:hypothetical protein
MDDRPVHGLEDLEKHLDLLIADPETPLDAKLIDDVELQLTGWWNFPQIQCFIFACSSFLLENSTSGPHTPSSKLAEYIETRLKMGFVLLPDLLSLQK